MATLNELGRNSSAITYGPSSTGADVWPTFLLVDKWLRNDTCQGTATATGNVITGTSSIYTTQIRSGDQIMLGQQLQTVASTPTSDSSITTVGNFSPAVSAASALRFISNTLTGTVAVTVRGSTTGTVSVTNGSTTLTGTGTLFTTEVVVTNRVIAINGRYFTVSTINSDTSITLSAAPDFSDSGLYYKTMPRGTIAVTASSATVTGTSTNFSADLTTGDTIWIGDEIRTITFTGGATTAATLTAATVTTYSNTTYTQTNAALTQAVSGITIHREDTYLTGTGTAFLTELRVGDELIIAGSEVTVTQIISNTSCRVSYDFPNTISGVTAYKKRKVHGYFLEGTREGGNANIGGSFVSATKWSLNTTIQTSAVAYNQGAQTIVVASGTAFQVNAPIKVVGGGGPAVVLSGYINTVSATTTITGTGTLFTTELYVGAEIMCAGQYLTVAAIASNTSMTVIQTVTIATSSNPFYRPTPLYTYITSVSTNTIGIALPLKNCVYSTGANPPQVSTPGNGADFIEYVYSSTNKTADASVTLTNTSLDRKYMGFRYYPLYQGTAPSLINTIGTAVGGYGLPVYERWVASYGQAGGVGVNQSDLSGGVVCIATQATTTLTTSYNVSGIVQPGMSINSLQVTALNATYNLGQSGAQYTIGSGTITAGSTATATVSGVSDVILMTQTTGGFLYMFGTNRYFVVQGKSFANLQQPWVGCIEFERSQPEDVGGTSGGVTGVTISSALPIQTPLTNFGINYNPGIAPWPTYAYVHANRLPIGAGQVPTLPNNYYANAYSVGNTVHGGVVSVPRVRNSAGDLVGLNASTYSACVITTGRWGHMFDLAAGGAYTAPTSSITSGAATLTTNTIPQVHMGQLVPVYTNVYNSKRFMFSPIVVLGPMYDPDIRGRMYGLKIVPSNLGTLMDTVSITTDSNYFYDSTQAAADHWVLTAPGSGGTGVTTYRFTLGAVNLQSWRSLEDTSALATSTSTTFTNNFRFALPA